MVTKMNIYNLRKIYEVTKIKNDKLLQLNK